MAVKTDNTGKRWVEMEYVLPGTPEQVWQAMATGDGNETWFTKARIEERVGGELVFTMGADAESKGQVTFWEPPHKFGYVEPTWAEGAPPVATEITITARSGDECIVRMVHSLFSSTDAWDDQMEGFETGWPGFFAVLCIYLKQFAGQKGASFQVITRPGGDQNAAWKRLTQALAIAGADVGDRVDTAAGAEPIAGVVEEIHQEARMRTVMLRLETPPGVLLAGTYGDSGGMMANVSMFQYGPRAHQTIAESERKWASWMEKLFS